MDTRSTTALVALRRILRVTELNSRKLAHQSELTDAGQSTLERSPDLLQNRFERGFECLEEWEPAMIVTTLERVAALLDAEEIEAAPVLGVGDLDRIVEEHDGKAGS